MMRFLRCFSLVFLGIMTACGGGGISTNNAGSHTSAVLQSIQVTAGSPSSAAGLTQQFTASGSYNDGSNKDLTNTAVWSSSNSAVATISNTGIVKAIAPGSCSIVATVAAVSGKTSLTVAPPVLNSIAVTSASSSVAAGATDQFTATGTYSDGSTRNLSSSVAWTVSSSAVASISSNGLATAKSNGSATITATQAGVSGVSTLTVASAALLSITVTAASPSVAAGLTDQFTAVGNYSDGSTQPLTNSVTWSVSTSAIASISSTGLITAKSKGSVTVTAALGSISGSSPLSVGSAQLVSIAVTPTTGSVGVGFTDQIIATGTYSDSSTQDISSSVTWTVSNSSLATISGSGLLSAKLNGSEIVTAASGSISGTASLTITISLVSIAITPHSASVAPGTNEQFKATGTFTDGSTQDVTGTVNWSSSVTTTATISNSAATSGLAQALHAGTSTISATSGTISAPPATLTVSSATLTAIAVTPASSTIPLGVVQQFTATGTFSDSTVQDITNTVTWSSSQPTLASITVSGAATARNLGKTSIVATSGSITGSTFLTVNAANLVSLAIQPAGITIAESTTSKLSAIGTFNDGSTRDVSAQAAWSSSNPAFATVQTNGKLQGISPGSVTATATLGSQTTSVNVTVTNATVVSISVTPSISTLAPGTQLTYTATGQFSDSSTQVISSNVAWSSSDTTIATISTAAGTKGIATTVGAGTATITATFESISGTAQLNVSASNLKSIAITPPSAVLAPASTQQYVATATYDDGTTQNVSTVVTWSSSSTSTATVTAFGQATGQSAGTATITATLGAVSGTSTVLVESSALDSITVTPASSTIPEQIMTGFIAIGTFGDGSSQDLTAAATWTSSNAAAATVSNAPGTRGIATGIAPGTSTISAVFAGEVGTAGVTVTNATLVSLAITPASPSIALGTTQNFVATGTFSDGSSLNLSTQVAWTSSNVNVAVINAQGLATSASSGTTTITATLNGVSTTAILTVN